MQKQTIDGSITRHILSVDAVAAVKAVWIDSVVVNAIAFEVCCCAWLLSLGSTAYMVS